MSAVSQDSVPTVANTLGDDSSHKPLTRARIERISSRVIAGFGLVFAVQVIPSLLQSLPMMAEPWGSIRTLAVLGGIVWVAIAALLQRGIYLSTGIVAVLYLTALVTWPLVIDGASAAPEKPWLWYLCTVATGYAALAFRPLVAAIYTVITPVVYGVLHTTAAGGSANPLAATLDASYAVILGGALLIILTMVRQAASQVDAAQSAALERYSDLAREHAHEVERVQVDALVHDSVLTTLLAAAQARTPEAMAMASRMATDAIGHLDTSSDLLVHNDAAIGYRRLSDRILTSAQSFSAEFTATCDGASDRELPVVVADALHAATVQAMMNSVQHAGDETIARSVAIRYPSAGGIEITVADAGSGFDPATVAPERLGLRISIDERVTRVGGEVHITSAPGTGTAVVLSWNAAPDDSGHVGVHDSGAEQ